MNKMKTMRCFLGVFLLLFFIKVSLRAEIIPSKQIFIDGKVQNSEQIAQKILFFRDSAQAFDIEKISEQMPFELYSSEINIDTKGCYWIYFELENPQNDFQDIVLDFDYWDFVDFYYEKNASFTKKQTGYAFPFSQKNIQMGDHSYIRLLIDAHQNLKCWVKLRSAGVTKIPPNHLSFSLLPYDEVQNNFRLEWAFATMFVGIFIVLFFYNLFIFISTKDINYLYYLGILFCNVLIALLNSAMDVSLMPDEYVFWKTPIGVVINMTFAFFLGSFAISFLQLQKNSPNFYWTFLILIFWQILCVIFLWVGGDILWVNLSTLGAIIMAFTMLFSGIWCYWKNVRQAKYYLFGNSFFVFFAIFTLFLNFFPNYINVFSLNAVVFGSTLEAIFFSIALANRINILRDEKEAAQQENLLLIKQQNDFLSQKVAEQTKELREAHQEMVVANEELRQTQEELMIQHDLLNKRNLKLETYQHKIDKSIASAQTIQNAILPTPEHFSRLFPQNFIFYLPKDIVSGDFYWCHQIGLRRCVALADCTGHGVSGAFMTIVGSVILDRIIDNIIEVKPEEVLNLLNHEIRSILQQEQTGNSDGMDIIFLCLQQNEKDFIEINFASAKRPLYFKDKRESGIEKIQGSRKTIGGFFDKGNKRYEQKNLSLPVGSMLYLTTDGFADQNNDFDEKRYSEQRLIKFLDKIYDLDLNEQLKLITQEFEKYKATAEQRDDVSIIGIRLTSMVF